MHKGLCFRLLISRAARLALARAIYSSARIVLLDDVIAAVGEDHI